jgi:subtilisin family serine protease
VKSNLLSYIALAAALAAVPSLAQMTNGKSPVTQDSILLTEDNGDDAASVSFGERPPIDLASVPDSAFVKGVIHIKFKAGTTAHFDKTPVGLAADGSVQFGLPAVDKLNSRHGIRKSRLQFSRKNDRAEFSRRHRAWGFHLWHTLELPAGADIRKVIADYQKLPDVEIAEPEYKKRMLWTPNDPRYNEQWHYHNTGQQGGTPGCDIHLPEAWDITKGDSNVIVAVVDGGINFNHPDLAASMWSGKGYNFVTQSPVIQPVAHGTHVAGTIAAVNNNGIGVCGIAGGSGSRDGVRLMSCQVFTATGSGNFAQAYIYAADSGAAISQNSWGYTSSGVYEQSVLNAIDYFNVNGGGSVLGGGITIFAAGNNNSSAAWYPGYYSGVIAVAATNKKDIRSFYSDYGSWVDIAAPGGEFETVAYQPTAVLSTYVSTPDTLYNFLQGTSMACPHVSGVAALVISLAKGKLSPADVKTILLSSTDNINALNPGYVGLLGTGRLNAYKALVATQAYLTRVSNPAAFSAKFMSLSQIDLAWQKNENGNDVMVAWNTTPTFGTPANGTAYTAGQALVGGGTILYNGNGTVFSHTGTFTAGSAYYYKAWSLDNSTTYSIGKTAAVSLKNNSRAVSITVPGPGYILFEASGYFYFPNAQFWSMARASLSLNNRIDPSYSSMASGYSGQNAYEPFSMLRGMAVGAAGTYTAYLVGEMIAGSSVAMLMNNVSALYIPQ